MTHFQQSNIIIVRHAETEANLLWEETKKNWDNDEDCAGYLEDRLNQILMPELIDTVLSVHGIA